MIQFNDKIEIIKGPGTLLYGNNGFAGVVNIINPLIAVDKPFAEKNYELGFGYKTSGGELGTALKLSKSLDNYAVRGSGSLMLVARRTSNGHQSKQILQNLLAI